MYDIAMNINTNDLVIQNGDLMVIDNAERVAQQIAIHLRFFNGEWFLNTSEGVPYFEYILVKNPNLNHIRQVLREAIEKVSDVIKINYISLNYDRINRILYVGYEVKTAYGLITRKEVLGYGRS